jgi:hypothetical protein
MSLTYMTVERAEKSKTLRSLRLRDLCVNFLTLLQAQKNRSLICNIKSGFLLG